MIQTANTNAVRILVAKHVPDLRRMEPHNIGVVVWSDHGIAAKFIGDDEGKFTGFPATSSIKDWVSYWKAFIGKQEVRDNSGKLIHSTDPAFFELLKSKSKAQYALVDAGELLDKVDNDELKDVAESLFMELVSPPTKKSKQDKHVLVCAKQMADNVRFAVSSSDLQKQDGFRERYPWVCINADQREWFNFDYAIHDGGPQLIMQRVPWKPDKVYSTAYQFDSMSSVYKQLTKEKCVSLVYASQEDLRDERIESEWNVLNRRGKIINVYDVDSAISELNSLASLRC